MPRTKPEAHAGISAYLTICSNEGARARIINLASTLGCIFSADCLIHVWAKHDANGTCCDVPLVALSVHSLVALCVDGWPFTREQATALEANEVSIAGRNANISLASADDAHVQKAVPIVSNNACTVRTHVRSPQTLRLPLWLVEGKRFANIC